MEILKFASEMGLRPPLNLDKIHKVVEEACEGLGSGVSASQVEMNSGLQFFDGIETKDIQEILVRSASDLISLDAPNYQFVAARLLLYGVYTNRCLDLSGSVVFLVFMTMRYTALKKSVYDRTFLVNIQKKSGTKLIHGLIMNVICYLHMLVFAK